MHDQTGTHDRVSFAAAHHEIVQAMRPYSAASIIDAALRVLRMHGLDQVAQLRAAPWQTLLLVKWALESPEVELVDRPAIPQQEFDALRQRLHTIWGWAEVPRASGHLLMRQIINAQVEFQRPPTFAFMRQPALVARLQKGHVLRQKFLELFGIEPDVYLDLAYTTLAAVYDKRHAFTREWYAPLEASYGEQAITAFLGLLARDLQGLRKELERAPDDKPKPSELFEFPLLNHFPLYLRPDGTYESWHPMVISRGLEMFVHRRFSALGGSYTEKYGVIFESYVVELLQETGLPYLDENALKGIVGAGASVPEAAVCLEDCNVFIEAKMGLFPDSLFVEASPAHLRNRTKAVRKAIKQGRSISASLRASSHYAGRTPPKGDDFLIVVTNRELNLSRGDLLASMSASAGGEQDPLDQGNQTLPLANVLFVSIDDFERLTGMLRAGTITLNRFLYEVAAANARPETSAYYLGDHLSRKDTGWPLSALMANAVDACMERLCLITGRMQHT
jgi:hypothetical protein